MTKRGKFFCAAAAMAILSLGDARAQEARHFRFAHDQQLNSGYSVAYDIFSAKLKELSHGTLLVDTAELEQRRAALPPVTTPAWARRGYAHLFHETILQADEGCDFDFMRGKGEG